MKDVPSILDKGKKVRYFPRPFYMRKKRSKQNSRGSILLIGRRRFNERSKRVLRRKERDTFRYVIMPAMYLFGAVGFLGFMGCVIHFALTEDLSLPLMGGTLSLMVLPCLFILYGIVRGHHSSALNEP